MAADKAEIMEGHPQASAEGSSSSSYKEAQGDAETLPAELLIKHPLQNKWTLWFFRINKNNSWEENQCEITSFDTVEDFWALYNHIEFASKLAMGCDYSLFKHGIKPMWEDVRNKKGGRWLFTINSKARQELDDYWLETMLCLIGEAFDEQSDEICGAVINIRRFNKISIWTADAWREEPIKQIGRKFKDRLRIPENTALGYQSHEETSVKTSSTAKNRFTV